MTTDGAARMKSASDVDDRTRDGYTLMQIPGDGDEQRPQAFRIGIGGRGAIGLNRHLEQKPVASPQELRRKRTPPFALLLSPKPEPPEILSARRTNASAINTRRRVRVRVLREPTAASVSAIRIIGGSIYAAHYPRPRPDGARESRGCANEQRRDNGKVFTLAALLRGGLGRLVPIGGQPEDGGAVAAGGEDVAAVG